MPQDTFEQRCAFYGSTERHLEELREFLLSGFPPETLSIQPDDEEEKLEEPFSPTE
jgi:hypothetical protein